MEWHHGNFHKSDFPWFFFASLCNHFIWLTSPSLKDKYNCYLKLSLRILILLIVQVSQELVEIILG